MSTPVTNYRPFAEYLPGGQYEPLPRPDVPPSAPPSVWDMGRKLAERMQCARRSREACGNGFLKYIPELVLKCSENPRWFLQLEGDRKAELCEEVRAAPPVKKAHASHTGTGRNTTKVTALSMNPALMSTLARGVFALRDGLQSVGHEVKETAKEHPCLVVASVGIAIGAVVFFSGPGVLPFLALL